MDWIKIDKDNLNDNEVLAANFKSGTYGYKEKLLGYLNYEHGILKCENEYEELKNVTHYIDIHKHDL